MIKLLIPLIITFLFLSCGNPQPTPTEKLQPIIPNKNLVAYIELLQGDSCVTISDSLTLNKLISNINASNVELIKFGSSYEIIFCDKANNIIEQGYYRDNRVKFKGVVYKVDDKIGW